MSAKKERRIECISELLTQQMNHWMLFSLVLTAMGCMSQYFPDIEKPDILMWVCCGILPVLTFLVRRKVTRFFPFMLCNLIVLTLTFAIPAHHIVSRGLCILCGVGYLIHTFLLRIKADTMFSTPFHPAVGIGLSLFGIFFLRQVNNTDWDSYYAFSLIGCLALYLFIYYMNHYLSFLSVNESSSSSIPASEMFRSGMGLAAGYTMFGTVLLLLCMNLSWLEYLLNLLKKGLIIVLRFLFSLFPDSSPAEALPQESFSDQNSTGVLDLPPGESSRFWEIMEIICVAVFFCAAVVCSIKFLLWIIRFIKESFGQSFRRRQWDVEEDGAQDIREKCSFAKTASAKSRHSFFGSLSPGERIRRLYQKKLLGASAALVKGENEKLALLTAREAEGKLGAEGMAVIYEKVRYSEENVSAQDVKRMKEACR